MSVGNPEWKRSLERNSLRWKSNIAMDLKWRECEGVCSIHLDQNRDQRWTFVTKVINLRELLDQLSDYQLFKDSIKLFLALEWPLYGAFNPDLHTRSIRLCCWLGIAMACGLDGWGSISGRARDFSLSTLSRPAQGRAQPPIQRIPGTLSPGVNRPGCGGDDSPPSSAEVKNGGIHILFMAWPLTGTALFFTFTAGFI
jgi:hypothetical protein